MLRLARIKRILDKYENLIFVQEYANVFMLMFAILLTAHFLGCLWYVAGLDEFVDSNGQRVEGWVRREWWNINSTQLDTGAFEDNP